LTVGELTFLKNNEIIHHRISCEDLKIDKNEIFRYLGYPLSKINELTESSIEMQMIQESILMMKKNIQPQGVYQKFKITSTENEKSENIIKFADASIQSKDLAKNLSNCESVIIFAITIGSGADLLIKKYSKINPALAAILQATGSMLVESYADKLNELINNEAKENGYKTHPRFSPGYGDLSLLNQNIFFRLLNCTQKIGLTLMDSFIMAPEKSITAFIGLEKEEEN
jgi:cobalamin-dependent methionine synthase I